MINLINQLLNRFKKTKKKLLENSKFINKILIK